MIILRYFVGLVLFVVLAKSQTSNYTLLIYFNKLSYTVLFSSNWQKIYSSYFLKSCRDNFFFLCLFYIKLQYKNMYIYIYIFSNLFKNLFSNHIRHSLCLGIYCGNFRQCLREDHWNVRWNRRTDVPEWYIRPIPRRRSNSNMHRQQYCWYRVLYLRNLEDRWWGWASNNTVHHLHRWNCTRNNNNWGNMVRYRRLQPKWNLVFR